MVDREGTALAAEEQCLVAAPQHGGARRADRASLGQCDGQGAASSTAQGSLGMREVRSGGLRAGIGRSMGHRDTGCRERRDQVGEPGTALGRKRGLVAATA